MSDPAPAIREGYVPGAVERLTALHATYYGGLWDLGPRFEADIAEGLADAVGRLDDPDTELWTVVDGAGDVRGGVVVDGRAVGDEGAQIRYVILDPALHGAGYGRDLLERALAFCDDRGVDRVFLWTVDELEAAVGLYRDLGFEATDRVDVHTGWETDVPYRLFERTA